MSKGPYSRLDVSSTFHRKVLHLGNAAWGAFLRLVSHTNNQMTDGWVDERTVALVCSAEELDALTTPFPWEQGNSQMLFRSAGGYLIHDFFDWNDSAKIRMERSESKTERARLGGLARAAKAAKRQLEASPKLALSSACAQLQAGPKLALSSACAQLKTSSVVVVADVGSDPDPESESQEDPERLAGGTDEPEPTSGRLPSGREQAYERAYVAGVEAGKSGPFVFPDPQRPELHRAILTFARKRSDGSNRPLRGAELLGWIEAAASDFATAVTAEGSAKFYAAYGPRGFVKWLNEQESRAEARRVG